MNRNVLIAVIAAVVVVPAAIYTVSPYFTETSIDESSPIATSGQTVSMQSDTSTVQSLMEYEDMTMGKPMTALRDLFQGAGDGIHHASGDAVVLHLNDGNAVLRLENFRVTNGPDLYVYLSTDTNASDFVDLGRLKASSGNQNYELPDGVDLSRYNHVNLVQSFWRVFWRLGAWTCITSTSLPCPRALGRQEASCCMLLR